MTVRVLFILPPVWVGFINYDIPVSISDKLPVFDFLVSPRVVWIEWTHGNEQMHMWISVSFIVNTPIRTHALVYKVFLNIICCIFDLFLPAPFFRE